MFPHPLTICIFLVFRAALNPKAATRDMRKPGTQQQASSDATGSSDGAHPARLYHDVSEEAAGWAHQIEIRSDL